jgi:hypothetical protein
MGYAFENTPWHELPSSEQESILIMQAQIRDGSPTLQERLVCEQARMEAEMDIYLVPPPAGAVRYSIANAETEIRERHEETRLHDDCHGGYDVAMDWRACETFCLARVRGVQHSVYLIRDPDGFSVIDFADGGAGPGFADVLVRGMASYPAALMRMVSEVAAEPDWQ